MKSFLLLLVLLASVYNALAENVPPPPPIFDDMKLSTSFENSRKHDVPQEKDMVTEPFHKQAKKESDTKKELNNTTHGLQDIETRNLRCAKKSTLKKKIDNTPLVKKADGALNPALRMKKIEKENCSLEAKREKIENHALVPDGIGNPPHDKRGNG